MFGRCGGCGRLEELSKDRCGHCRRSKRRRRYAEAKEKDPVGSWVARNIRSIQTRCKQKGTFFALKPGFLLSQVARQGGLCWYCSEPMDFAGTIFTDRTASVDRVVPSGGYKPGNVVLSCARCNRQKADSSIEDLERLIRGIRLFKEGPDRS
jgi:5-methylcytosine-specific restriction endonuclease McrA